MRVSVISEISDAYMYYNPIITININMHVTSAPRRRSRGLAWRCHTARSATSHPRGSRAKI